MDPSQNCPDMRIRIRFMLKTCEAFFHISYMYGYADTYPVYVDNLRGISCMLTTCGAFFHVGTISEMCTPVTLPLCSVPHYGINASLVNALIKAAGRKEGRGGNVKKGNFPEKLPSESLQVELLFTKLGNESEHRCTLGQYLLAKHEKAPV